MDRKISLAITSLAVASIALAPSLFVNQHVDAKHSCRHAGHTNSDWIEGCIDGWFDCDHGNNYSPGSGQYKKGYNYGWEHFGNCGIP